MAEFDVVPAAQPYYDRVTLEDAIEATTEAINDWDYAADPHGYCHERPFLVALVTALRSPNGSAVGPTTPEMCSTCNQPLDSPPCSLNRDTGWSGHTVSGGVVWSVEVGPTT